MILDQPLVKSQEESKIDAMEGENVVQIVAGAGLDSCLVDDDLKLTEASRQNMILLKQSEVHAVNPEDGIAKAGPLTCSVLMADTSVPEADDSSVVEASGQSQGNAEDEKCVKKVSTIVSDSVSLGELKQPKVDVRPMDINSSPIVVSRQSQEDKTIPEKQVKKAEVIAAGSAPVEGTPCLQVDEDTMILDGSPAAELKQSQPNVKGVNKRLKRKRPSIDGNVIFQDKEALISECRRELDDLFEYYKEVSAHKMNVQDGICSSNNHSVIACLLEESNLPFPKLVEEIYEKMRTREGITLSLVRSAVLTVGQRMMYGIDNADANVLEDESEKCLWCWETRDMKLLPRNQRGILSIRRTARKKIQERISVLSAMLLALAIPENLESYQSGALRASEKLGKVLNVAEIRSLVERLKQRDDVDMVEKDAKLKEKELIKEMERNKRIAEKEKKRIDRELQKEKVQSEKERRRLQEEAEKEEQRREKEEAGLKRQLKKQQEEDERDQRRREKEEVELKKQISIQKQASIMERFLKSPADKISPMKRPISDSSGKKESVADTTTSSMDFVLAQNDTMALEDLRKLHFARWHKLSRRNRFCRWGIRCKPKVELIKNPRLQRSSFVAEPDKAPTCKELTSNREEDNSEPNTDKPADQCEPSAIDNVLCHDGFDTAPTLSQLSKKKLLQFDKSHRPAYYGTWQKSASVGPRRPFAKDVNLDYDVDSDEEWEEEEPGESLSDCDKDDEEECLEEEDTKAEDDNESEDSFVVPDGYLSVNEEVRDDSMSEDVGDEAESLPSCKPVIESEEFRALLRQQKYLQNLTEQALRKSQPLVISNLTHEKAELMIAEDLSGTPKIEQVCLQALCMRACPGGSIVDASVNSNPLNEDEEICQSQTRSTDTPMPTSVVLSDSEFPEFVTLVQSHSHSMNKVLDSLQRKFPAIPKSQLKNKVREISDFVDNRWQVKKEVLDRIGLSSCPDKPRKPKGIAALFSKRCLPP